MPFMHERLISYLRDNRDQIIENWLTAADLPLPANAIPFEGVQGTVPLAFLEGTFERILSRIEGAPCRCNGHAKRQQPLEEEEPQGFYPKVETNGNGHLHLDDFLNVTCACALRRVGGRVCIELRNSGIEAFFSVFENGWDAEAEFNDFERERCKELISNALTATFGDEVQTCQHRHERVDCPFALK